MRRHPSPGFTLFDMLVVITIIGIAMAIVMPELKNDSYYRIAGASQILTSDIELAQIMTISDPDNPVIVKFEPPSKYSLAYAASAGTPIPRPDNGQPYVVTFGVGRARGADEVVIAFTDGDLQLDFNDLGGIAELATNPVITLSHTDRWVELEISASTGAIVERSGSS